MQFVDGLGMVLRIHVLNQFGPSVNIRFESQILEPLVGDLEAVVAGLKLNLPI